MVLHNKIILCLIFCNKNNSIFANLKNIFWPDIKSHFKLVIVFLDNCSVKTIKTIITDSDYYYEIYLMIIISIFVIILIVILIFNYFKLKFDWHSYTLVNTILHL